ncbi:MAG: sugar ABC transporter ATP-binding protein [Turicibacter sp.]|nr:sugar ABC transporter ATP-binding protein [Turicibacter sp.]
MEQVLKMENIIKTFGETQVLKNVNFDLIVGEVHALAGGNGAGKSTLMKIMTGVYTKDSGDIYLEGKPVRIDSTDDAKRQGIAMIFQELSLVHSMTIAENIFLGDELKSNLTLNKKEMNQRANIVLQELGIDIDPNLTVENLSVGMSQMVEIAKAVNKQAKIIVFDEPTASLSAKETEKLFELIENLKQKGTTIVYISHRMNEIMQICDRITILKDGAHALTESLTNLTLEQIVSYFVPYQNKQVKFEWKKRELGSESLTLLSVNNLTVENKVQDVSFSIREGEIVGIAGLMGSGRTEILETLFGIRPMDSGSIEISGKKARIKTINDAINAGLGLVPEDRRRQGLVLEHTLKENFILPSIKKNPKLSSFIINEKNANQLSEETVEEFNVKTSGINKVISLLSGGNQQKIVIAKWMKMNPKVMLLDEPTAGVDIGAKSEIINIIRNYADKKNGVLLVSSELTELLAACDRILVLYEGRLIKELNREEIKREEELQHAIQAG